MKALTVLLVIAAAAPAAAQTPSTQAALVPVADSVPAIPVGSRVGQLPSGYDDGGRRDPFASLIVPKRAVSAANDGTRGRTGLGGVSLNDVTIRGVIRAGTTMMAILEGPNKQSFTIRPKDRLFDATVVAVDADGVVFSQQAEGLGASQVRKSLRPAGEGIQ
ncbi:MAG TPA: hypothetical protein VG736_09105 [Vicinamibacterales bacterium]|jgi:hypothetical protein|nr:hypothetical protein [Vicinamibacterales bacterium]